MRHQAEKLAGPHAFPLSFAQQRLWFLDQLSPENPFYNLPLAVPIAAPVDQRTMGLAINEMARRHETLRTCIRVLDNTPQQIVMPFVPFALPFEDLSTRPRTRRHEEALAIASQEAGTAFDLEKAPLIRVKLLCLGARQYLFLVTMHHIISDGWSMGVFWRELTALYTAAAAGKPPNLLELPLQYGDFAEWQREWLSGDELERQKSYWRKALAGLPVLSLPTDRTRPPVTRYRGAIEPISLSVKMTEKLRSFAMRMDATLFMVLYAAFAVLLSRYSGQRDFAIGTPIVNRSRVELEEVIGIFVNSLVLRIDLTGQPSFETVVRRSRETLLSAYAHQEFPFECLVEELNVERDSSRNPLFQVTLQLFVPPAVSGATGQNNDTDLGLLTVSRGTALFDLAANFWETGNRLKGQLEYDTDLFEADTILQMRQNFEDHLEALLNDPTTPVDEVDSIPPGMSEAFIAQAREEATAAAPFIPIWHSILAEADAHPEKIVLTGVSEINYATLIRDAKVIAARLQAEGVELDNCVAVIARRSPEMIIAICGIFAAGAAYVPIDPETPVSRISGMIRSSGCKAVLTEEKTPVIDPSVYQISVSEAITTPQVTYTEVNPHPDALAYVIYTSGSTGVPKGVAQRQAGLANQIAWMREQFQITEIDKVLFKTPFTFDASVWEIFLPLTSGASLEIAAPEAHRDPRALCRAVVESKVTVLQLVPSMLHLFLDEPAIFDFQGLRLLFSGGEALPTLVARNVAEIFKTIRFYNIYGPTETCIQSVAAEVLSQDAGDTTSVPIGQAIPGNGLYVLGDHMGLLPKGIPGELYIAGEGLARGYLSQPGATAERFLPNPFGIGGERLYRTGDRVVRRSDNRLTYLGRFDQQTKIRGFRVEPGEVEAALNAHPLVRRAVISVANDRLVAHVEGSPSAVELRRYLQIHLPKYMIPSVFVLVDQFPLLSSGKIDRLSLPKPDFTEASPQMIAPRDPIESALADIWAEVLEVPEVGIEQDFFADLGGHSLLATRIVARIRDLFQISFPLQLVFEQTTIAGVADALRQDPNCRVRILAVEEMLQTLDSAEPVKAQVAHE